MVSHQQQQAFTGWLRGHGGYVNPKVSLFHQLASGDRGVYSESDIKEGEQLLLVPVGCTLHLDVSDAGGAKLAATCNPQLAAFLQEQQQQPAKPSPHQQEQQLKPFSSFLATTLMLMSELAQGSNSAYKAYFDTLPVKTDCLINWSDEEQQLLEGSSLSGHLRSIQDIFEADIAPRLAQRPDLFEPGGVTFDAFRRAADLVQTRAFHMSAENWLTGASQESTDELYLIPAIDMLNHSTDPSSRNTTLSLCRGEVEVTLEDGTTKKFKDFFSMRAEANIPAGTQILHTYGDLGDAQLLQTYGFIDICPAAAAAASGSKKPGAATAAAGKQQLSSNPHNYVMLPVKQLLQAVKVVAAAAKLWPAKQTKQVMSQRLAHLASVGLLQPQQPDQSQLVVAAADTLPDQLLTIVQVLMMTQAEFKQLQQAEQEEQAAADNAAKAANTKQPQEEQAQQAAAGTAAPETPSTSQGLNLGREMLQDEFGELCATVVLQAIDQWLKRYPRDLQASLELLSSESTGSRPWLAAAVSAGEQMLLQQMKKEALMVMLTAAQDDEGEDEDEGDEDEEEDEDEEVDFSLEESSEQEQEEEAATNGTKAASKRGRQQRQEPGDGGDAAAEGQQHGHKKHKKHKKHKHAGAARKDDRPHYGDMTGPKEKDVWESDDSDKVGYSSGSDGDDTDDDGDGEQRHPVDPSEHHTYEVGAAGTVRESHGHMLGPEEAALIESDDSDKVGYQDEEDPSGAAGAGSKKRGGKQQDEAAATGSKAKKPKRGLGYEGK